MKILINRSFGGFGFSDFLYKEYKKRTGDVINELNDRTDKTIIDIFEEFGSEKCSDEYAKLKLIEIPDDIEFIITEYDGIEKVEEVHRTWC